MSKSTVSVTASSAESLEKLADFVAGLGNVQRFEVLPYHRLAIHKYEELGLDYPFADVPEPTKEDVARAEEILRTNDYQAYRR